MNRSLSSITIFHILISFTKELLPFIQEFSGVGAAIFYPGMFWCFQQSSILEGQDITIQTPLKEIFARNFRYIVHTISPFNSFLERSNMSLIRIKIQFNARTTNLNLEYLYMILISIKKK